MHCILPIAGIVKSFKGRVPQLLRHPNGASVIDDAYNAAYPAQRNAMAAEFYGKQFTLFEVGNFHASATPGGKAVTGKGKLCYHC